MRRQQVVTLLVMLFSAHLAAEARAGHPFDRAEAILQAAVPHVEKACGAVFATPPVVRVVTLSEAERLAAQDLRVELERKYPGVTEGQMRFLLRMSSSSSVRSAIARYSIAGKAIVLVRAGFDGQCASLKIEPADAGALLAAALCHEAVHALDDQRFDLGKLYGATKGTEALLAAAMVVEGRAVHFGRTVATALGVPRAEAFRLPGGERPKDLRTIQLHETYRYGARFVAALVRRGGTALADRAMREPPKTSHHVCQPDRWPDGKFDPRPAAVLDEAGLGKTTHALSELELRALYRWQDGKDAAEVLFAGYRGGAQAVVEDVNLAVLAFADEASAKRYADRSRRDAAVLHERGTVVLRASSASKESREALIARIRETITR